MRDGFVKVAAATPEIAVADCKRNAQSIIALMNEAEKQGVKVLVFPELCLTGYTAGDLFYQPALLRAAEEALAEVVAASAKTDALTFVGVPVRAGGDVSAKGIFNCAAAVSHGTLLGLVPKTHLPAYNEFYEKRQFTPAPEIPVTVEMCGFSVPMYAKLLFCSAQLNSLVVGAEICEDLWTAAPPSTGHAAAGASIIVNLSASDETIGKAAYRRSLVATQSARLVAAYVYADAGEGESTTDMVFSGHDLIAENGRILAENAPFGGSRLTVSEADLDFLAFERTKLGEPKAQADGYVRVKFDVAFGATSLTRVFPRLPFVPDDGGELVRRAELILEMQARALAGRMKKINSFSAVVGVSGGLDSCLALLVAVRAFDFLGKDRKGITAISMPCFGTTKRTRSNAQKLSELLGVNFRTIDITAAVKRHLCDIGHDGTNCDVTYENAQARERTQVLMDVANATGGLVVGTGDLSELALGWATYNGDHMSSYGVNASVPKTLVRYLVRFEADRATDRRLAAVLNDILATPVSPELLPPKEGEIAQKTEDLVGPYELHDFFLYCFLRCGYPPAKIYRLAVRAFEGEYDRATVAKWLRTFIRRFFSQQFKRSCLPDGVKIGSVALSPRGDWRMPSDASPAAFIADLDRRVKEDGIR